MDKREVCYNYWRLLDRFEDSLKGNYSLPHHEVPLFDFETVITGGDNGQNLSEENLDGSFNSASSFHNDSGENLTLDQGISACKQCGLSFKRIAPIPGFGSADPLVMVILDPPDLAADEAGRPLVSEEEEFLLKWFDSIDLKPEDLYITNIVKCRPPGLREPFVDETAICRRWLLKQIEEYRPSALFICGERAARLAVGKNGGIDYFRNETDSAFGLYTQVTHSPRTVMEDSNLKRPVWEDLKKFRSFLNTLQ